MTCAGCVIIPN